MSVIIRKKDTGEIFDIPSGFTLEVNNTSSVFNDIGSKSVTTTIPRTPTNSRLLGYAFRPDIDAKPESKIPIIIYDSTFMRRGMLYLSSAYNTSKGYGVTLAFAEGIMYEEMKSVKLPALSGLPVVEKDYPEMKAYMDNLFVEDNPNSELTLFPISLKDETYSDSSSSDKVNITVLNDVDPETTNTLYWPSKINVVQNNALVPVDVPAGYGVSPFVKVWYILERIFSHFGYDIEDNPFRTDYQLRRLCVLNNVTDSLVMNNIDYSQLLPDITVIDFLKSLKCRFGLVFFVDGDSDTVNMYLLKQIFENNTGRRLDTSSLPDIDYTEPKQLKLSCAKSLDRSSTEKDTYGEFLKKYRYTMGSFRYGAIGTQRGLLYSKNQGLFALTSLTGNYKIVSSVHFDWDQQADMEYEELSSVDEGLTIDASDRIYYGISGQLLNSRLLVDSVEVEAESSNKLAFAWDMGEGYSLVSGTKQYWGYKYGSIFPYVPRQDSYFEDKDGNVFKYALTFIGEDGCFNRFHSRHDAFLRHSNYTVKADVTMPLYDMANLDYKYKYDINNQPLLIDKVNHVLGDRKTVSMELRTTRLYRPYDLDADHALPETHPILYKWDFMRDYMPGADTARINKGAELMAEGQAAYPDYVFESFNTVLFTYIDPLPQIEDMWFLPPTYEQYINQELIGYGRYKVIQRCAYKYYAYGYHHTEYYDVTSYYAYFHPVHV